MDGCRCHPFGKMRNGPPSQVPRVGITREGMDVGYGGRRRGSYRGTVGTYAGGRSQDFPKIEPRAEELVAWGSWREGTLLSDSVRGAHCLAELSVETPPGVWGDR